MRWWRGSCTCRRTAGNPGSVLGTHGPLALPVGLQTGSSSSSRRGGPRGYQSPRRGPPGGCLVAVTGSRDRPHTGSAIQGLSLAESSLKGAISRQIRKEEMRTGGVSRGRQDCGFRERKAPSSEKDERMVLASLPLQPASASLIWGPRGLPVQGPPKQLPSQGASHMGLQEQQTAAGEGRRGGGGSSGGAACVPHTGTGTRRAKGTRSSVLKAWSRATFFYSAPVDSNSSFPNIRRRDSTRPGSCMVTSKQLFWGKGL